jgi:predicted aconitase with swiveling domain
MAETKVLQGRCIVEGRAEGEALVTKDCISFMGSTNPKTG